MQVSYGLPAHRVDLGVELCSGAAVAELGRAAEAAGLDAVYLTEHPFPSDEWMQGGGHHALDPLVGLATLAGVTERLRLHTHLFIPSYRNPYLAAKSIATLDVMSEGRVILGVGTGYLVAEFAALGARFAGRNDATDDALRAMRRAWSGETVTDDDPDHPVAGNSMLPRPVQQPGPPIWVGGNSDRALRRAIELGDGWAPFQVQAQHAGAARSTAIATVDDLARRVRAARERCEQAGRTTPLEICFTPTGLDMHTRRTPPAEELIDLCGALAAAGVTWITAAFPAPTRAGQLDALAAFGADVLPHLRAL